MRTKVMLCQIERWYSKRKTQEVNISKTEKESICIKIHESYIIRANIPETNQTLDVSRV